MLLTFPQLLTYGIVAPLVLRLALAVFFVVAASNRLASSERDIAITHLRESWPSLAGSAVWYAGFVEFALGILFAAGFLTQIAAAVGVLYAVKMIVLRELATPTRVLAQHDLFIYIFIFAASVSLLLLGAGTLGLDAPL